VRAELAAAIMLLTRLPAGWLAGGQQAELAVSVWAFPPVGAAVGGIGAAAFWLGSRVGLPPSVNAVWTLAAMLAATGALHEDGLADTADGFLGGRTPDKRMEIMRDSRIGSFGALALMLALAARGTAIAAIASPGRVAAALVAAGALGRGAILIVLLLLAPARQDGLAAGLRDAPIGRAAAGLGLAAAAAFVLLPGATALWSCVAAAAVALALAWTSTRQIGGYTGDVLGAASVAAECVVLSLAAAG
jgi:adenosylcobinamide-GDP ribazoletransferase